MLDKGDKLTEDQAKTIVQQTINNYNLDLSDTQINLLVNFAMNLSKSSIIDSASFKSTLSSLKDSIVSKAGNTFSGINLNFNANKAVENSKNIFAQIWQAIVDSLQDFLNSKRAIRLDGIFLFSENMRNTIEIIPTIV